MTKFRLVPPAGAPLPGVAVLSTLRPSIDGRGLTELLRDQLKVRHVFTVSSGRAALTIILHALKKLSDRREVVIPAYTCFSVPSAVVRAGLNIRLCDVDPKTLDLDHNALARLDLDKVLCIIPSSLYGMPADLVALEEIARASGAFLVDDAAQCLGATLADRPCGTFGNAGFYSLGRGKNITTMGGGILVTKRNDLAQLVRQDVDKLPRPSSAQRFSATLNSILYASLLPLSRYWVLDYIPFLGLGLSRFDPHFKMTRLSSYQERLASRLSSILTTASDAITRITSGRGSTELKGSKFLSLSTGRNPSTFAFPSSREMGRIARACSGGSELRASARVVPILLPSRTFLESNPTSLLSNNLAQVRYR